MLKQLFEFAIILYVAVCKVLEGFDKVPPIVASAFPAAPPVKPPVTVGVDQVYVVPVGITSEFTPSASVKINASLLHAAVDFAVIIAFGLIVATTVKSAPVQLGLPAIVGLTVYVAVCATLVGLLKLPEMLVKLLPAAPPVRPPVTIGADQVYVVPLGTMSLDTPFVIGTLNNSLLHAITFLALIKGFGFTVIVTEKGMPWQLPASPDTGVTVYTTV